MASSDFHVSVANLRAATTTRVVVMRPVRAPDPRIFDQVAEALAGSDAHVEIVDTVFLQSLFAMRNLTDVMVIPDLDSLDVDDYRHVVEYARAGGSIVMASNDMFTEGRDLRTTRMAGQATREDALGYFRYTKALLGIKPYESDVRPTDIEVDADFIAAPDGAFDDLDLGPVSVGFNTTSHRNNPYEQWGTQFVERREVLRNYPVVEGLDPHGQQLTAAATFAQNWETGANFCLFNGTGTGSVLDPESASFAPLLQAAARFATNRIMVTQCQPRYACYRQGESAEIDYALVNFADNAQPVALTIEISDASGEVFRWQAAHSIPADSSVTGTAAWSPDRFESDYYEVKITAGPAGGERTVVSKATNGFVVWHDDVAASGPKVAARGPWFELDGRPKWLHGANYYESNQGSQMWIRPNVKRLHDDLQQMGDFGLAFLRIHYHHPKWFYDHYLHAQGFVPDDYRQYGESYLPTERDLRTFDAHIYLCQKFGLVFGGDLFSLRPDEMGDARGWFGVQDYMLLPEALEAQKEFLDLLIPRYTDVPGIAWDIYNEPMGVLDDSDTFYREFNEWTRQIIDHMRGLGDHHIVTVGDNFSTGGHEPVSEYLSWHANFRWAGVLNRGTGKPELLHEVWLDRPPTPSGNALQLDDMREGLINAYRTGLAGFSPWQWTEQAGMWQAGGTFGGENWDDFLGCCVRYDQTVKPSGRFFRDFNEVFGSITLGAMDATETVAQTIAALPNGLGNTSGSVGGGSGISEIVSARISTDDGELVFTNPKSALPGDFYALHRVTGRRSYQGVANRSFELGDLRVASETAAADIFFSIDDGLLTRFTVNQPGRVTIDSTKAPKRVFAYDPAAGDGTEVSVPEWATDGTVTTIGVLSWHINYWFALEY